MVKFIFLGFTIFSLTVVFPFSDAIGMHVAVDDMLVEYWGSHSIDEPSNDFENAVVVIHGANRNPDTYFEYIEAAAIHENILSTTLIIAPKFKTEEDEPDENELYWSSSGWKIGYKAKNGNRTPSFKVIDEILMKIQANFLNVNFLSIIGHSAGGQFVQRFAAISEIENELREDLIIRYAVANPGSYMFLTSDRPESTYNCMEFDEYKYGISNLPDVLNYTNLSKDRIRLQLLSRSVYILLGKEDNDPESYLLDTTCEANSQGFNRFERGINYLNHIYNLDSNANHTKIEIDDVGHSLNQIMNTKEGRLAVFFDDYYYQNYRDSNLLFNWVETTFSEIFFPPNAQTLEVDGIIYRYYPGTDTYIGALERNLFLYGSIFNGFMQLGVIEDYLP